MTSRFFPWESFQNELGTLQFPWRIFVFATLFIALFGGAIAKKLDKENILIFISVISVLTFYSVSSTIYWKYEKVYKIAAGTESPNSYDYENNIGLGEYLPTGTNKSYLRYSDLITTNGVINDYNIDMEDGVLTVKFNNAVQFIETGDDINEKLYIDLPLIMYKGYKASLETSEGTLNLPVSYGINNVIRVYIGDTKDGTLKVWYDGTTIQKVSFAVTIASFGVIIVYFVIIKKRRKKEAENASLLELNEIEV